MSIPTLSIWIFAVLAAGIACAAPKEVLEAEKALLAELEISADELMPLNLDTELVRDGQAQAVICHADEPAWNQAAQAIQNAVRQATGVELPLMSEVDCRWPDEGPANVILVGHLDNNRIVARLYHNFFVCLDQQYTGPEGYVIRSIHDPFGGGKNAILVGGSKAEGTARAAQAFAELITNAAHGNDLSLGRLQVLELESDEKPKGASELTSPQEKDSAVATGRKSMFSPGQARNGVSVLIRWGYRAHRTGDPVALEIYRDLMHALLEYYQTDTTINEEGMARYDGDFRDAWTHPVGILWDLLEESGAFSDQERLDFTNLLARLALECVIYQGYNRPGAVDKWRENNTIVHNHNTFPALGIYFVGRYLKTHYNRPQVEDWLTVAEGIFAGQKHSPKPLEDAAAYQWLPIEHVMIYSLAQGDTTFFDEGHAREAARVAMMVMDNMGYQAAFGDHTAEKSSSGIRPVVQRAAWYYKDPELLWGAELAGDRHTYTLGQPYNVGFEPRPAESHVGVSLSRLPKPCYDYIDHSPQYPVEPNLPWAVSFDKLAFRAGLDPEDQYMLLDGFGRGTHMHFDANAIVRYSDGGEPLLVDGEYIKNAPKYHCSLAIMRNGQTDKTPAVTGLGLVADLDHYACTRTYLNNYSGSDWQRRILWRRGAYFLVLDTVTAKQAGDFTLRSCWRPWGDAQLDGGVLTVDHKPMRLVIAAGDAAPARLENLKTVESLPVSRLSRQVGLSLQPGGEYRFVNLVHSFPQADPVERTVRRAGADGVIVEGPGGPDVIVGRRTAAELGIETDADLLVIAPDRWAAFGATKLSGPGMSLTADGPVSVEMVAGEGLAVLQADGGCEVSLQVAPNVAADLDGTAHAVAADGTLRLKLEGGAHRLGFEAAPAGSELVDLIGKAAALPVAEAARAGNGLICPELAMAWKQAGFEAPMEILRPASITSDPAPRASHSPVERLVDGMYSSSIYSAMWPAGQEAKITLDLGKVVDISSVSLREWHMNEGWDIAQRSLELSDDGFQQDVRTPATPFTETGTESWGNNVNTIYSAPIGQKARYLRLTATPARTDSAVYIAEIEVRGTAPGATPEITDITSGDIDGDGAAELLACSKAGEIQAFRASGEPIWSFASKQRAGFLALACGDVDGDGKDEVMAGGLGGRAALLSSDGKLLWEQTPPPYRGISPDVMTILAADLDGDGKDEMVCGCKNWQYVAYRADGTLMWANIIYAHSATVSCADDFDGDGLPEIVAGNEYYRINLIDNDGKRIYSAGSLGPDMTAVSSADVDGDGLPEVLVGTDGGDLLCYDGNGAQRWLVNLGDRVTRIIGKAKAADGTPVILAAAESANVFALNLDGSTRWRTALPDGAGDIALSADGRHIVAAAGSAGIVALDAEGKLTAHGEVPGRAIRVLCGEGQVVAVSDAGEMVTFRLP